jgi:hypothetical protein
MSGHRSGRSGSTAASANTTGIIADGVAAQGFDQNCHTGHPREGLTNAPRYGSPGEVVDHLEQVDDGDVEVAHLIRSRRSQADRRLGGCTRRRGRRHPNVRTKLYQVEEDAQTLPSRCEEPRVSRSGGAVLDRGHHVLERSNLGRSESMGRFVRTPRLVVPDVGAVRRSDEN